MFYANLGLFLTKNSAHDVLNELPLLVQLVWSEYRAAGLAPKSSEGLSSHVRGCRWCVPRVPVGGEDLGDPFGGHPWGVSVA